MLLGYAFSGGFKLSGSYDSDDRGTEKMKVYGLAAGYSLGGNTIPLGVAKARNVTGVAANADDDATLVTL